METNPVKSRSLFYRTYQLALNSEKNIREIGDAIGMTPQWVHQFKTGRIKNPGVNTMQRLYEYLADEPLFKD